jgi:cell division protein FtsI (penicillin-binding protein 3)
MADHEKWIRIRIRLTAICFILAFGFIVARAFQLQVLGQDRWEKKAARQYQRTIPLIPQRGTIFDRAGQELAVSVEVDSLYVVPAKVVDPQRTARLLADALKMPLPGVRAKLKSDKSFLWLKRQVSPSESQRVQAMKLDGVGLIKEHRRYYPNSEIGAQVIGFTGLDPQGLEGLELAYDTTLLGEGGFLVMERDALGRGLSSGSEVQAGRRGSDLYLTLDKTLQYIAEKELAEGVNKTGARAGSVVMIDPMTGAVLAMASQPDYNPNAFQNYRPSQWRNRTVCDTFEPGSTIKVFLLAAALNEKLLTPQSKINCENGTYRVGSKDIHDHRAYAALSVPDVLKFSSNIGAVKVGKLLERDRYYGYLRDFGFGESTGLDLPGEVGGVLRKPSRWFAVDLAAISFGQGLAVTPLQLVMATAAIANGGYLMSPYIVDRVVDSYGQIEMKNDASVRRKVVSRDVADEVRKMMTRVTDSDGTGSLAAVPGYKVAGKTGTAQKVDPVTGTYAINRYVASFVGFVPANDPRLVILVVLDEPKGQDYGGLTAAPVFSRVASQSLRYLKILPTEEVNRSAMARVEAANAMPEIPEVIFASDDQNALRMPDFAGMSYRQVLRSMENMQLNIRLEGSGRVVAQSPKAGQPIRFGSETWVRLEPPS